MTDTFEAMGSCLCGTINIKVKNMSNEMGACHCDMCQKWTGGPLLAVDCGSDVTLEGKEYISVYDSSDWAERGFCNKCGNHLFYRLKASQQYMMPVGLFDTDIEFVFDHQIFIESKPNYYHFGNQTKEMTGEEVFALYTRSENQSFIYIE